MIIAESNGNSRMTKTHTTSGTKDYDDAFKFKFTKVGVKSFKSLCRHLQNLEHEPTKCILRGDAEVIKEGHENLRRLKWKNEGGHLVPAETQWLLFDFDGESDEWATWVQRGLMDGEGTVRAFLAEKCPPELARADVFWQFGSSFGVNLKKFSLHLWVFLSEPVLNPKEYCKKHGFDGALSSANQVHYIARPIFEGMDDPVAVRSGVIEGDGPMDAKPILECQPVARESEGDVLRVSEKSIDTIREMFKDSDASEGDRHAVALNMSLQAIANGMEREEVERLTTEKLVEWGYNEGRASNDARNMVKGATGMAAKGQVELDGASSAFEVKAPEVKLQPEAVVEQQKVLTPSLLDIIADAEDKLEVIKKNPSKLAELSELQMIDLEDLLIEDDVLVDGRAGKGQISRGRLGKVRKEAQKSSGGTGGVTLDQNEVERLQECWQNTYCSEDHKSYYLHSKGEKTLRGLSKKDELDAMCKYLCAGLPREQQILFQEKFFREIHEQRMIKEWISQSKPFGRTEINFEHRGDGKLNVIIQSSVMEHIEIIKNRYEGVNVPVEFERWLDEEYGVVWEIMQAVLARRFLGDKRSTIWVHCSSNWGKSFFFGIKEFAMSMENSYSSEDFKGNDHEQMGKYIYLFVDEADRFTKEMKLDSLSYRKLYGGHSMVTLPARIIASANPIGDLSDGVDQQLINRVSRVNVTGGDLGELLTDKGWGTQKARHWYEALLVRKFHGWMMDWEVAGDFVDVAGKFYKEFSTKYTLNDTENIEKSIKDSFWNHFLFDHLHSLNGEFKKKEMIGTNRLAWASDYLWVDNGSEREPDRRRLYMKRVGAWMEHWMDKEFGKKRHAVQKCVPSIRALSDVLGGNLCERLPNQKKFKGVWFDLTGVKEIEEGG